MRHRVYWRNEAHAYDCPFRTTRSFSQALEDVEYLAGCGLRAWVESEQL